MLKGFLHAHLACGCRVAFREGSGPSSPVTVFVDLKAASCANPLHVRNLPVFDHREALRPATRPLPIEEEFEEEG